MATRISSSGAVKCVPAWAKSRKLVFVTVYLQNTLCMTTIISQTTDRDIETPRTVRLESKALNKMAFRTLRLRALISF